MINSYMRITTFRTDLADYKDKLPALVNKASSSVSDPEYTAFTKDSL